MKIDKQFMAFGKMQETSVETGTVKRFIGVGAVSVIGLNPTKTELEKLYGTTLDKDPVYLSKKEDGTNTIRLDFIIKTCEDVHPNCPFVGKYSVFLEDRIFTNREQTKLQVIDAYGETAWVTNEEFKTGVYTGNNKRISTPYRPALVGEEKLLKFIKTYFEITDSTAWDNNAKAFVKKPDAELEDAKASFDNLKDFFTGNLSEIRNLLARFPQNKVKLIFGIKTTDDNKLYQDFYSTPIRYASTNYSYIGKELINNKVAYPNTIFSVDNIKEYVVQSTDFESAPPTSAIPSGLPSGWGNSIN